MRTFAIQANSEDTDRIFSHYSRKGELESSFLFRGCGNVKNTAFYVTHGEEGEEGGYYVMDCAGLRCRSYTQEEFAFYVNGLIEYNPDYDGIEQIVTIECFGGYHRASELQIGQKAIHMRPLSPEKAVLWAGWRKKKGHHFLLCVAYSDKEYEAFRHDDGIIKDEVGREMDNILSRLNLNLGYQEWKR